MDAGNLDKRKLFKKLGYEPHTPAQWAIHESAARFRIPCCGRRWGKSIAAGNEVTAWLFKPDSWYWIVGPDYSLAEKEFRVVYNNIVHKLGLGNKIKKSYSPKTGDMRIEMPWNTVLEVKSAKHNDSLVGEGLDGVCMSEAAKHSHDTWERYVGPALADKRGSAIFPSTPEGFNWYYGLYQLGEAGTEGYQSWCLPTWTNPVAFPGGRTDPEIMRVERDTSPQWFAQEYGAQFTTFVGQIYDEFDVSVHVTDIEYVPQWRNFWVFDYGYAAPFVCLDIMVDPSDNVYVWREYQVTSKSTWEHGHALKERLNPKDFHVDALFGDPHGADEAATLGLVLGFVHGNVVGWSKGIEAVKRWLKLQPDGKPKLTIDRSCTELIRQMQTLRSLSHPEDKNPKEGQHDYDDHGPDALRYFFSEFFVLGANESLSAAYDPGYRGSEAESFFTYHSGFKVDTPVGYD